MKIITWNVNGFRSIVQKGLFDFCRREDPDVLCLQETKCHPDQLENEFLCPEGWQSYWNAGRRPGYSGTATFTRQPALRVQNGFGIPKFDFEGRVLVTQFQNFLLYNCYFPNGGSGQERQQFKEEFLLRFGKHLLAQIKAGEQVIVVGDYNVAYMDEDVYDPHALALESGFLPQERKWMRAFLENGFVDGFRFFHPHGKNRFTWWSYFQKARLGNRGWRIDHICVSKNLAKRLKSVEIMDDVQGSDHCPVVMEIDL